jgi:hypothetical protein
VNVLEAMKYIDVVEYDMNSDEILHRKVQSAISLVSIEPELKFV